MPWRRSAERSEIIHLVVTGYQKRKYPRKYYVFVIDVTWTNNDRFEIYRRYSEFFSFQTTLKAMFPDAAGRRNKERTIPQLPKRIFVGRSHVAKVAEARLEQINKYCQILISLAPKISRSAHVIGFFSPRIGDKALPKLHLHRPASLHPQIIPAGSLFEEYCALAEFQAEEPSQVSLKAGEMVLVVHKDNSGWWRCQVNGKVGWAPPSYLKKVEKGDSTEGESDSDDEYLGLPGYVDPDKDLSADSGISVAEGHNSTPAERKFIVPEIEFQEYKAIDSYEAQGDGQVSFEEGDIIQVLDKIEDGWWFVAKGLEEGWVPCSYLEPLKVGQEDDTISSLDIEKYVTVEKYTAEEDDELSFPKGVTVDVLQKSLDGWWLIKHDGKTALAPATFLVRKEPSENSPPTLRKASTVTAMEPLEEEQENEEEEKREKEEVRTSRLYQQPPRRHSVRRRISNRTTRLLASNPPFLNASASHVAPDTLKQSNSAKATETTRESPNHSQLKRKPRVRKISEQVAPTQSPVSIEAFLPGQRKASIDSGLPILIKTAGSSFANGQRETPTDVAGSPTSNLDSDTEDHEYFNIDPQAYLRERQHQQNLKHLHSNMSPTTSDSEIDVSRSWRKPMKQGRKGVQSRIKRWEQGSHGPSSDSEDSITSPPTSIRPPIATPRTNKPELKPKPKMASIPQMPPRPHVSQINRARSKQPPKELQIEQPLQRPPRPRVTEIRRARVDKASRSPTPLSTPTPPPPTSITEGRHSGANSRARQQTNSKLKSMGKGGLSASMGSLLEAGSIGEQSQKNASSGSTASSLAPPNPDHRQRGYYSDTESNTPPSNSIPLSDCPVPSELAECSTAMNQQMAETLIKYIMSSQDSGLKSALLDCIKGNNEILNSIRE